MNIELSDQEINLLLNILGDAPAKVSFNLLQNVSVQVANHNKRIQGILAEAQQPRNPGVLPPGPLE